MKRLALRALYATLFAGGLTLLGAGVAHASETSGDDGILSGSQVGISIELPVTVGGNAISLIGDAQSSDASTEVMTGGGDADPVAITSGEDGIGSGTQALIDVSAPVTIGGNAISVIGDSSSSDAETVVTPAARHPTPVRRRRAARTRSDAGSPRPGRPDHGQRQRDLRDRRLVDRRRPDLGRHRRHGRRRRRRSTLGEHFTSAAPSCSRISTSRSRSAATRSRASATARRRMPRRS